MPSKKSGYAVHCEETGEDHFHPNKTPNEPFDTKAAADDYRVGLERAHPSRSFKTIPV